MIGTLTDAGPLVAIVNEGDPSHAACMAQLPRLTPPMVTTWPCFTEAMYLAGGAGGHRAQDALWAAVDRGALIFHESSPAERVRMRELMAKYKDTPMDLADTSLVAAAEALGARRIFTIDSDFYVYRTADRRAFEIVP